MHKTLLATALTATFAFAASSVASGSERQSAHDARKDSDSVSVRQGAPQTTAPSQRKEAPGISSDGEALGMLQAVNEHEIAAAKIAEEKGVSTPVMDYAKMLEKEHSLNASKTREISDRAGVNIFASDDVDQQKMKGDAELATLRSLNGDEFERAYVDAMIQGHQDALMTIDDKLLPGSKDPAVIEHIQKTREHIAHHLQQAQQLDANSQAAR